MLNERVRQVEREKAGLVDPTDEQRKRPLKEHLAEFKVFQRNKGVTEKQAKESTSQVEKMMAACKWKLISDISATDALEFLGQLRARGRSAQTSNHYLKSAKTFTRWLVRNRRAPTDALAHLSKLNVNSDRRHDRRALCEEEFRRLLDAARNGKRIESIPGADRVMMYTLASWTGFRKGEIGSLTLRSLDLDGDPDNQARASVAALGLAVGASDPQGLPFDFLFPKRAPERAASGRRRKALVAVALIVALVCGWVVRNKILNAHLEEGRVLANRIAAIENNLPSYKLQIANDSAARKSLRASAWRS